jgi:hypothetical protein
MSPAIAGRVNESIHIPKGLDEWGCWILRPYLPPQQRDKWAWDALR